MRMYCVCVCFPTPRGRRGTARSDGNWIYRSETDRPHQRLRAITFVVVNRFSKTRRISRALAVAHPRARGAYASPPASFSSGLRPALVRCQVAQGPRSRAGFAARGGEGGGGMALGRASARLDQASCSILLDRRFLSLSQQGRLSTPRAAVESQLGRHQGIADGSHVTALCASLDGVQPRPRPFIPRPSPATQAAPFQSAVFRPQNILMSHHVA